MIWLLGIVEKEHRAVRVDRVAEDVYTFVSDMYAQVVATVILTGQGAVVVDAMPFPTEAREVAAFIEDKEGPHNVRYVINTHHHADHVYGTYLFEGAEVIAHDKCRELLAEYGQARLLRAKQEIAALADVELRLPDITFGQEMYLHLSGTDIQLLYTPGHTVDGISVFVAGDKVLIAGDAMLPVPHIVGGDVEQLKASLKSIKALKPNFIVQGHGEVLLRGEVDDTIDDSINYLSCIVEKVSALAERGDLPSALRDIDIESCGKSRIPLDGLVNKLHLDNLVALYKEIAVAN
jgi:cyclase